MLLSLYCLHNGHVHFLGRQVALFFFFFFAFYHTRTNYYFRSRMHPIQMVHRLIPIVIVADVAVAVILAWGLTVISRWCSWCHVHTSSIYFFFVLFRSGQRIASSSTEHQITSTTTNAFDSPAVAPSLDLTPHGARGGGQVHCSPAGFCYMYTLIQEQGTHLYRARSELTRWD